jgi:multiple sugar transport system permease protein
MSTQSFTVAKGTAATAAGRRPRRSIRRWGGPVLLIVLLSLGAVLMMVPFLWMLLSSFKTSTEIRRMPPTLLLGYRNSIIVSGVSTLAVLFTSSLAGFVFAKKQFRLREPIFFLVLSTMMVPFLVLIVPLYFEMVMLKLNDSLFGLIVPAVFSSFGIFMMRQFMHGIPNELIEAAIIDGATDLRIFLRIIVPLTKPALSALGIFTFMGAFDSFLWPLVIIDSAQWQTLPLVLARMTMSNVVYPNWQMAAAVLSVIPVIIVYIVFQRNFVQGIALTGLKA